MDNNADAPGRALVGAPIGEWSWVAIFMLTQSLFGLSFYPAAAIALFMIIVALRNRPYHALFMITIMAGGYSMNVGHFRINQALLLTSIVGFMMLRKTPMMKRVMCIFMVYVVAMFLIASTSDVDMFVQFKRMQTYWLGITFMIPLLIFANKEFDIREFARVAALYIVAMGVCYFFDCFIFNGYVFFPYGQFIASSDLTAPSFTHLWWDPLSFTFPRIGPNGLVFCIIGIYLLIHFIRLRWWMWMFVGSAFVAARTATVTTGMVLSYIVFKLKGRKLLVGTGLGLAAVVAIYFVDSSTGRFLRVADTVDQFTKLEANMDDETLAEFGTGRMAQWIPKYDLLTSRNREWVGYGFLDPFDTKSHKYTIDNSLYDSVWDIEESVTGVEVAPMQTILDMGYLGLILQFVVYLGIYYTIRKLKYAGYYGNVLMATFIAGIGGMGGWNGQTTLLLIGLSLGVVLLLNRQEIKRQRELEESEPNR